MGYSFRFFGRHPTDWKGAEHAEFSVQFASAPDADQKVALAQEMLWIAGGGVIDLEQVVWRWSGAGSRPCRWGCAGRSCVVEWRTKE